MEICADLLYSGQSRKEILQHITEKYKASEKTVDNWLKEARPIVATRQATAEQTRARVDKEEIEASAKRLNITRERVSEQYAKIAFYDPEEEAKVAARATGEGAKDITLSYGQLLGIKAADVNKALDSLCRVFGYNAPDKADITTHNSGSIDFTKYTDEELRLIADLQRKGRVGAQESA